MRRTGSTDILARKLIRSLQKQDKPLWKVTADMLQSPSRKRTYVNLYKIEKYAKEGEVVVVPGKVLGIGSISKPVTVVALDFSKSAIEKINKVGGKVVGLCNFDKLDLKGKHVRLMRK
ncbi:50S ribosomal protein L18e [Acidianus sp. RZ1]|uniref:50S ribosomal protein L18e n=1 Tax=Acidianus sp. RZ1 TaxID=1540082 RepID=UPI001492F880|nr:50S ribosomal protein L18e [Acidianus sp. RZ1]NON62230.1 50S ribosomal protein L18e [Acidianus sp. RZ1]